jgi:F-type H+-transporting ATPase subunit b
MLDLNLYLIIGQMATFLVGLTILWFLAYRPITNIFKKRADKISADLAAAEKARSESERLRMDYEAQIARVKDDAQKMMNETVKEAQSMREEILNAARDQSREILDRALQQIEFEKEKAVKELRQRVLEMSLLVAEKTIGETINRDLQHRLVEQLFEQIEVNSNHA